MQFPFVCYTDDGRDISSYIEVRNIEELRPYDTKRVFTYEKLMLIDKDEYDKNFWIDLDVLVHKNITDIIVKPHDNITFIWNYWNSFESLSLFNYGRCVSCHTNSSFVGWDKGKANWLLKYTHDNWDKISWTYKSLDKYMFYQHHRNNRLNYWPKNLVSNYNIEGFELKKKITLFNTSHIKANNLTDIGYELEEATDDILKIWKDYELN